MVVWRNRAEHRGAKIRPRNQHSMLRQQIHINESDKGISSYRIAVILITLNARKQLFALM